MATIPVVGHISDNARTEGEVKQDLEDIVAGLRQVPGAAQAEVAKTISGGSITPDGGAGVIVIDTEAAASTDDLTNIIQTNHPDGSCILLRNSNVARFVVLKHAATGAGEMILNRSVDYVLDDTTKWILLQRRSTQWHEVFRGPYREESPVLAKTGTYTVAKEDVGKTLNCTNSFTLNLLAAAAAGDGFTLSVRNTGTGTITIDPNSSELIDGNSTLAVTAGTGVMLVCNGSAWFTVTPYANTYKQNPIINGNFDIWQRNTTSNTTTNFTGYLAADRWYYSTNNTSALTTVSRSTNVPSFASAGVLFNYSLEVDVTTADAAVAAGDVWQVCQKIEGYNWRHFAQRQFTLSFWVMSSVTGTYSIQIQNSNGDRRYIASYVINSADTWEFKSVTVTASPSAGTWDYTSGIGLFVCFTLMCGSSWHGTGDTWLTGSSAQAVAAQANAMSATTNFFRLTGVKLELGNVATPIEFRSFQEELQLCQRYYTKSFNYATAVAQNAGTSTGETYFVATQTGAVQQYAPSIPLPVVMRTAVAVNTYNPSAANAQPRNLTDAADCSAVSALASDSSLHLGWTGNAGQGLGDRIAVHWTVDSEL